MELSETQGTGWGLGEAWEVEVREGGSGWKEGSRSSPSQGSHLEEAKVQ